ncbi:MAG: zinc ribbon domain-containing protein [Candidatus Nanopelagicus sp.]
MQASVAQQSLILELQSLDNEIMQANTKLKSLPEIEQLLHIDKRVSSASDELATVKAEAEQIGLELKRSEVDVETVTDRIKKDEARLASGNATPKELEQLQHEIVSLKKRQEELEEIELEIMIRSDAATARSNTLTTDLTSLQTLKDEISGRLQTATDEINKVIADKNTARNLVANQIEKPLLDLYEKIRTNGGGVGAAALVGDKCNGCNLAINAVEMERIKSLSKDELLRCEECRRILVRI